MHICIWKLRKFAIPYTLCQAIARHISTRIPEWCFHSLVAPKRSYYEPYIKEPNLLGSVNNSNYFVNRIHCIKCRVRVWVCVSGVGVMCASIICCLCITCWAWFLSIVYFIHFHQNYLLLVYKSALKIRWTHALLWKIYICLHNK